MSQSQRSLTRRYDQDDFALDHPFTAWMESFFNTDRGCSVANRLSGWTGDIRVDSKENRDSFNISADIPGVQKEDIKVSLNRDRMLTIEAERKSETDQSDDGSKTHFHERVFGKISRSFRLPKSANPEDCHCKYDNGVLNIKIGKREPANETNYLTVE